MRTESAFHALPGVLAAICLAAGAPVFSAPTEAAATAGELPALQGVVQPQAPRPITDFELTDQNGRTVAFSSLRGKPLLVFFGYASCPDVCPTTLLKLRTFKQSAQGEFAAVPVVMISVDGERDTPAVLKNFLAGIAPDFIGLTGDPRKVRDIAAQFPAVFFKGLPAKPGEGYPVEHTFQIYAVDRAGRVRAEVAGASLADIGTVTRTLLAEKG